MVNVISTSHEPFLPFRGTGKKGTFSSELRNEIIMCATRLFHACNLIRSLVSQVHSCCNRVWGTATRFMGSSNPKGYLKIFAPASVRDHQGRRRRLFGSCGKWYQIRPVRLMDLQLIV